MSVHEDERCCGPGVEELGVAGLWVHSGSRAHEIEVKKGDQR